MKKIVISILLLFPVLVISQNSEYNINSYSEVGTKAPNTHYIGINTHPLRY